jgi:uncharacterized membrane protein YidH (DUF202 family)
MKGTRLRRKDFYPTLTIWFLLTIATRRIGDHAEESTFLLWYLLHGALVIGWFALILMKIGEVAFLSEEKSPPSSMVGHTLTLAAFVCSYLVIFHWQEAAHAIGASPTPPSRVVWIMLSVAVGLFGGWVRARKAKKT